jgi:CHAD domain-containing protein
MRGEPGWPVAKAQSMAAPPGKPAWNGQRLQAQALHNGLAHLLPNLQALAAGQGLPEHVHQARVALRRLRVVLREFAPLATPAWDADGAWTEVLTQAFRRLGEVRDHQVLADQPAALREALAARGLSLPAAPLESDAGIQAQLTAAARDPALQQTLVALLARAALPDAPDDGALRPKLCREALQARVLRLHQQLSKAATRWADLSADERHSVRKRAKRLRYLLELAAPVLAAKPKAQERVQQYLKRLARVQQALGDYNDALLALAQADARGDAPASPAQAFLRGYWAAEVPHLAQACEVPLQRLRRQAPF